VGDPEADTGRAHRRIWVLAFAVCAGLVVVRNLVDLSGSPPGLYVDEASIGYNAWAIAHFGVDEHGIHFPLFFEAFGEYKNPVYIYALSGLLRVLPLTVAVERLPAAIFGLAVVGFLTAAAWRLTGSRVITLGTLVLTALTPWVVIESRVGFETISMVALLAAALWCLAGAKPTQRQFGVAGVFLGLAIYGYTTARLEILLLAVALAVAWGLARTPGWWRALVPVAAGYIVLGIYWLLNPGALTGRFGLISIWADGAPLNVVVDRFLTNYVSYFSPNFLFLQGDGNPRQNTEIGGMLLWVTAPLLLAGILVCWQRGRQPLVRFLIAAILLAPVAAALTNNGTPHALRSSVMLPFLIVLAVLGADGIRLALRDRSRLRYAVTALLGLGLLAQGAVYTFDLYRAYPYRAASDFDTGEIAAITTARAVAGGHPVYLSNTLDQPYIEACFALVPQPPSSQVTDDATPVLQSLGLQVVSPGSVETSASSGDLLVLTQYDQLPPSGWVLVDTERPLPNLVDTMTPRPALVSIYRFVG
jgi:hypothetical protein